MSRFHFWKGILSAACITASIGPVRADVIRFGSAEGPAEPVAGTTAVLRYDASGRLIGQAADRQLPRPEPHVETRTVPAPSDMLGLIRAAAARYEHTPALDRLGLSPADWHAFFQALIRIESGYRQSAISPAGAMGLAQLMPGTARALRVDARDPAENLDGGARYLLAQMSAFGSLELALAAYNAGPQAVQKYGGVPPYPETVGHIRKVMAEYRRLQQST